MAIEGGGQAVWLGRHSLLTIGAATSWPHPHCCYLLPSLLHPPRPLRRIQLPAIADGGVVRRLIPVVLSPMMWEWVGVVMWLTMGGRLGRWALSLVGIV
jgi:hypothetical protein